MAGTLETVNAVSTLGIDVSSQQEGTAGCTITWEADKAVVRGIDAFGWPIEFALAVGAWNFNLI